MAELLEDGSELTALMVAAHRHAVHNRQELEKSSKLGCFSCLKSISPQEVEEWLDRNMERSEWTGLCPVCNKDTLIGDASGFVIEQAFLEEMQKYWINSGRDEET